LRSGFGLGFLSPAGAAEARVALPGLAIFVRFAVRGLAERGYRRPPLRGPSTGLHTETKSSEQQGTDNGIKTVLAASANFA
jgi:hypothetical protein